MKIVDLTICLKNDHVTYPGDPKVSIKKVSDIQSNGFNLTELKMGTHTGTHVDLPCHFIEDGNDALTSPLQSFFGPSRGVSTLVSDSKVISLSDLDLSNVTEGQILLIYTGWDDKIGTDGYYTDAPVFSKEVIEKFVDIGIKGLGVDLPTIDHNGEFHKILLKKDIVIFEGLINLKSLINKQLKQP